MKYIKTIDQFTHLIEIDTDQLKLIANAMDINIDKTNDRFNTMWIKNWIEALILNLPESEEK